MSWSSVLSQPAGVAFDIERAHLYVADSHNHRVQIRSAHDLSFIRMFGDRSSTLPRFNTPYGVAIDQRNARLVVADTFGDRVQIFTIDSYSLVLAIVADGSGAIKLNRPDGVVIDHSRDRLIISDTGNHRLVIVSITNESYSIVKCIGSLGARAGEFNAPRGIAIDTHRDRLIVADCNNHRIQVLSANDGSFLFEFGGYGGAPEQLSSPRGVCVDNLGRIVVADSFHFRLQAYTPDGQLISSYYSQPHAPFGVAFDTTRGEFAYTARDQLHRIAANEWLPDTLVRRWRVDLHRCAPECIRRVVLAVTMLRSIALWSNLSLLPNELLFEIFQYLEVSSEGVVV